MGTLHVNRKYETLRSFLAGMLATAGGPASPGRLILRRPGYSLRRLRSNIFIRRLILLLLLLAGIHPNPGPSSTPLVVAHWNCNGLKNSSAELSRFLKRYNVGICCLQETKLRDGDRWAPSFPGFNLVPRNRPNRGGGGIAFLIRFDITFSPIDLSNLRDLNDNVELQAIKIHQGDSAFSIFNVYSPPASSINNVPVDFTPLLDFASDDFLLVGDFNAHHGLWFSSAVDARGRALAESIDSSAVVCLNEDSHTRRGSANSASSSPDITLASASFAPSLSWSTVDTLNSDHLPVLVSVASMSSPLNQPRRSFTNFRRANWSGFTEELESLVENLPPPSSCMQGEKLLRQAVLDAAKHNIPCGFRTCATPAFPPAASLLAEERDRLRFINPNDPEVARIDAEISALVAEERRNRFNEFVNRANPSQNPRAYYSFMRNITGKRTHIPDNQPISFEGLASVASKKKTADRFCRQYTSVGVHDSRNFRDKKSIIKNLKITHPLDPSFKPFSADDVRDAILSSSNSTAAGPDGLTHLHLKHFGARAIAYLTDLYNLSVSRADIPAIWKSAIIIPVLKPGKPVNDSKSYRPISLLSPCIKVLERLLLRAWLHLSCHPISMGSGLATRRRLPFSRSRLWSPKASTTTSRLAAPRWCRWISAKHLTLSILSCFCRRFPPLRSTTISFDGLTLSSAAERPPAISTASHQSIASSTLALLKGGF